MAVYVTDKDGNEQLIAGAGRVGPRGLPGTPGTKGDTGDDGNPIGTVISFLGLTAPEGYLVCDGASYSIADYPALSAFIAAQFGSANHFGGDGTATFAVPDLRNLFLRGYHGAAEEQLSGDVGERQEGTEHSNVYIAASDVGNRTYGGLIGGVSPDTDSSIVRYPDRITSSNTKAFLIEPKQYNQFGVDIPTNYAARPVNMAVLYCIKAVKTVSSAPPPTAADVSYDSASSGLEAETVQAAIDELQETKLAAIDGQPGEFMGFGPDGEPTALPASRGIPPGGGYWDVLKKKSNTDYDAGWTSITDIVVMNNAQGRNGVYRGGVLGPPTDEMYAQIAAGTFKNMFIGDIISVDWNGNNVSVPFYIAAFDYFKVEVYNPPKIPHHIVLVPRQELGRGGMNSTATTQGGYVGSSMYTTTLEPIRAKIRELFGSSHVMKHALYLSNAVSNGRPSGGLWVNTDVELMCEQMVYGSGIFRTSLSTQYAFAEKSQLPLYLLDHGALEDRWALSSFWLRDVASDSEFAAVGGGVNTSIPNADGSWTSMYTPAHSMKNIARGSLGIVPYFCLCG